MYKLSDNSVDKISYEIARTVPQGADVIHSLAKFSRAGYATKV